MAFARDLYKTKLCTLYQRGHCPRQNCSFAHGDTELRRTAGVFNGRRDYRGGDLRERLERRHSPRRRFSPGRDGSGRPGHSERRLSPHDRGHSGSISPARERSNSEQRDRKRLRVDGPDAHLSDVSGDLQGPIIEADESPEKAEMSPSPDPIDLLEEELRQVHAEIELLNDQKALLEVSVESKVQELNNVSARNSVLDLKLIREQEDHKRLGSKIKKFVKLYLRCTRAQEEVKKTQARLHKLVEDFPLSDATKLVNHGEESDVNIVSDGEPERLHIYPAKNSGNQVDAAMVAEKDDSDTDGNIPSQGGVMKRSTLPAREKSILSKTLKSSLSESGLGSKKNADDREGSKLQTGKPATKKFVDRTEKVAVPLVDELSNRTRNPRGEDLATCILPHEKLAVLALVKGCDLGLNLPSTGLAAHAEDEQLGVVDDEHRVTNALPSQETENFMVFPCLASNEDLNTSETLLASRLSQVSVISSSQYAEYKGEDEEVDVEVLDDGVDDQIL